MRCHQRAAPGGEPGRPFREDFPHADNDNWLKENIIRCEKGALEVYRRPVTITSMTRPKEEYPISTCSKR